MSEDTATPARVTIEFRSHDKVTRVPPGMTLFNAASWIGLPIDSTCGARGTCGKCKVRVVSGHSSITAADHNTFAAGELADGWRLSCRAEVQGDLVCDVPRLMGNPKAALMGAGRHVILNPNVHKVYLELAPPTLADQRPDRQRVEEALHKEGFDITMSLAVMRQLPKALRRADWCVTAVVVGDELVALEPDDSTTRKFGLAFDIGTTTVVGILMDLSSGAPLAVASTLNGQAIFGADVIARISHAMLHADGLAQLQAKAIASVNEVIHKLLADAQAAGTPVSAAEIYEMVVAGNATMHHLLLGIDPEAIGVTPFIPVVEAPVRIHAQELGLDMLPQGRVLMLPHLGAYVGADLVAGLLATGLAQQSGVRLLVDVGTNGEIILGSSVRTLATAAPAGPAFEGAQIKDGMRAADGAIEAVTMTADKITLQVIGDVAPVGICGSGLIDAVAQLRLVGLLSASGRFVQEEKAAQLVSPQMAARIMTNDEGVRSFVLASADETGHGRPIVLTQRDIRELQFAKGSIAGGIQVVMAQLGVTTDDLEEVYLAGSFGNYINPQSARIIGLVPPVPVERIKAVGNAAGEGAKMALLSFRERQVAYSFLDFVEYFELSGQADFSESFMEVLAFPELGEIGLG